MTLATNPLRVSVLGSHGALVRSSDFPGEFRDGDGLKNRRLRQCKISIRQVLIQLHLAIAGEVAERLKAAVC
jgi:hypothetical protein